MHFPCTNNTLKPGQVVRVTTLPGAPPPNTMAGLRCRSANRKVHLHGLDKLTSAGAVMMSLLPILLVAAMVGGFLLGQRLGEIRCQVRR
jgi:hypothetical protein